MVKPIENPVITGGIEVPAWMASVEALPLYSAVAYGEDSRVALMNGRKQIREAVARNVMKQMLSDSYIVSIAAEDTKRHILWMVAGRVGQIASDHAMQKDLWISPQKLTYVLAEVDEAAVAQIYTPIFREETDLLSANGEAAYLGRDAVKWR